MNFGEAIKLLKEGKLLYREGWNGQDLFVFRQVPAVIEEQIVPKMQSLPDEVKSEFIRRFNDSVYHIAEIFYDKQLALVNSSNLITGWSPSVSDALAEDWKIYRE